MQELNCDIGFSCDKHTAVLIDKETGEIHDLGEVINAKILEENRDEKIPVKGNDWSVECQWCRPLRKREAKKFRYFVYHMCQPQRRTYLSKRELVTVIERAFYPEGLPLPVSFYMKFTHRQLMNIIMNTAYILKKFRELPILTEKEEQSWQNLSSTRSLLCPR